VPKSISHLCHRSENVMPVLLKLYFEEAPGFLKPFEDPTLRDNELQIHDALIPIGKDEL
jgi:hypothetical protein